MSVKKGFSQRRSILRMEGGAKRLRRALGEMKAVRIFWEIMLLALCSASLLSFGGRAEASSASVTVETKNDKVHVGDTVYVVVTVRSAKAIRGFEGYFAYDHQYLRFESGGRRGSRKSRSNHDSGYGAGCPNHKIKVFRELYCQKGRGH